MNPTHYIFVDFENVQSINLDLIAGKPVQVLLVIGKKQTKVPVDLVTKLMEHSSQVRVVQTEATGRNALDFVLAFEVGVQSVASPEAHFHILSKDTGFDALVLHLKHRNQQVARHADFSRIPVLGGRGSAGPPRPKAQQQKPVAPQSEAVAVPPVAERVKLMTERITKNQNSRPKRRRTLLSHFNGQFGRKLTEGEAQATLDGLEAAQVIEITPEGAVRYKV